MVFMVVLVNADDDVVTYNLMVMSLMIFVCFDFDDFMSILSVIATILMLMMMMSVMSMIITCCKQTCNYHNLSLS